MATAATVTIRLDGDSATLIRELNKANTATQRTFGGIQKHAATAAKSFALVGAAAAAGFAVLVRQAFSSVDALVKASDQLGITTQALAGLKLAGAQASVGFEAITGGIGKMQRSLVEAAEKGGDLARAYDKLGVNVNELLRLRPEQQLSALADAFDKIKNPAERTALAMQVFGRGGAEMLPMLKGGAAELEKWAVQAQRLGIALSDIDAEKIDKAGDAIGAAKLALEGVATQFALAIAPAIKSAADGFVDFVAQADAFRGVTGLIAETITGVGKALSESKAIAAAFGAVGVAALTGLVNAANLLKLAMIGIDLAFASIQAGILRLKGAQPFADIGSQAREAADKVVELQATLKRVKGNNPFGINDDDVAEVTAELHKAIRALDALGAPGQLAPLNRELDKLKAQRVDLGGKVFSQQFQQATKDLAVFQKRLAELPKDSPSRKTFESLVAHNQKIVDVGQTGVPEVMAQIRGLDDSIAQLQTRIKKGGGEILLKVPTDAPRSEFGKLLDYIDAQSAEARKIPLIITPEQVLADARRIGAAASAAFKASADAAAKANPAVIGLSVQRPARLDFGQMLADFSAAAVAEQDLQRASTAAIQKIAVTGQIDTSGELTRIAEARAKALTAIETRSAQQQAAAAGTVDTFNQERALAKNRLKVAQDLAGEILAARQTVVEAGWAIKVNLKDDATAPLDALRDRLDDLRSERVAILAIADTGQATANIADLRARIAALQDREVLIRANTDQATAELTDVQAQIASLKGQEVKVRTDTDQATASLVELQGRIRELSGREVEIRADTSAATGPLLDLQAEIQALKGREVELRANIDQATGPLAEIRAQIGELQAREIVLKTDASQAAGPLKDLQARLAALTATETTLVALADTRRATASLTELSAQVTDLKAQAVAIAATGDTGPATAALTDLQARIADLEAREIALKATVDTTQATANLNDLDARIAATQAELASAAAGGVFAIDFSGAIAGLEAVSRRRADLQIDSNEEIRRIAIAGEEQISQGLQNTLGGLAAALTEIQRKQAELQAAVTGKPANFDAQEALYQNQIEVTNQAADALIEARARVAEGGPLALPTVDPESIRADTAAAGQAMLEAFNESAAARLEAEVVLQAGVFESNQVSGQALIELAARQAYEKVAAEFAARGQAMDDFGNFADPAVQAAFETQVQTESLTREQEYLNQRLQINEAFAARYGDIQRAITLFQGKQWADSNKKTLNNMSIFAGSALEIAGSLFKDNKPIAIANAVISTLAGAAKALELPFPANIAAMATTLAAGFAQVNAIRSTNIGSGASAGGGVGGGSFTPPAIQDLAESRNLGNPERQNAIQIIFNGQVNGWDDYIQSKVITGLREAIDQRDVVIFGPDSRQARDLQGP